MIKENVTLEGISKDSATIVIRKCIVEEEIEYNIDTPIACGYINSKLGREQLKADYPDYFKALELSVWGKTPTVEEEIDKRI